MDHFTIKEQDSITQSLKIKILYILKKASPKNAIFVYLFFLSKLIGMILLSHDFTRIYSDDDLSMTKLIRKVTFMGELQSDFFTTINYNTLSITILCILIFPFFSLFLLHKFLMKKKQTIKKSKITNIPKLLIKTISYLITLIIISFQHIIEILCFIFLNAFVQSNGMSSNIIISTSTSQTIKKEYADRFIIFNSNLLFGNYYFIFIINIISILLINVILFNYIKFMNEPYLNSNSTIRFSSSNNFQMILLLLFNCQGFHYFAIVFEDSMQMTIKQFFLFITLSLNFFYILSYLGKFDYSIKLNKIVDFFNYVCFFSNVLNLIIYYSNKNTTQTTEFSETQIFFKLIIEVALSCILFFFINDIKNKRLISKLRRNLFVKNKKINLNSLLTFAEMIENSVNDAIKFLPIFLLIDNHKNFCSEPDCACGKYEFNKYLKNLEVSRHLKYLRDEEKLNYFKQMYHDIITLAENEIVNSIHQFYKSKNIENNYRIFIFHIDFIFHFKRNNLLSNYLIEQYRYNLKHLPFLYRFHFYIYKKKLIKNFYENLKMKSTHSIQTSFLNFFKYHQVLQTVNKFIIKNCENFEKLIYIKKTFDNNQLETNNRDSAMEVYYKKLFYNVENIFKSCEDLNKHFDKLCSVLEKNFKLDRLRNIEICYLLFNFFSLINKDIPFEMRNLFLQIDEYCFIENSSSSFNEKKMHHPMIINTDKSDGFLINYISQKLCDLIDYKKNDLIGKDMHILIPKLFQEQHKLIMKKIIFLDFDSKILKESFLVTKSMYYFGIQVASTFLPTIENNATLILDILPLRENNEFSGPKKNKYKFILDQGTNMISYTKNFEENFFINLQMFKKLNINFCHFFTINYDKLVQKCDKEFKRVRLINNFRINDILKIFQYIDLNEALHFLSYENKFEGKSTSKRKQNIPINEYLRNKEKLIPYLIKLKKNIQEAEMDQEYLDKINDLEKKYLKESSANKLVNVKRIAAKTMRISSNALNTYSNENLNKLDSDCFSITFYLNNLGNLPYFVVYISENKENLLKDKEIILNRSSIINASNLDSLNYNLSNDDSKIFSDNFKSENNIFFNNINVNSQLIINKNDNFATNIIAIESENPENKPQNLPNQNLGYLNSMNFNSSFNGSFGNNILSNPANTFNKNSTQSVTNYNLKFLKYLKTNKSGTLGSLNLFNLNSNTSGMINSLQTLNNNLSNTNVNESINHLLQMNKSTLNNNENNINTNNNLFLMGSDINLANLSYKHASSYLSTYTNKSSFLLRDPKRSKKHRKNLGKNFSPETSEKKNNFISTMQNYNQDQVNSRERKIFLFLFILLIIQIFLSFFSFILKNGIAEYSFDLFSISYYALLTKLSLYYTSSSVISACTNLDIDPQSLDNFNFDLFEFQKQFKFRSDNLFKNLNKFIGILSQTDASKNSEIYSLINSEIEFKLLYSDWSSYTRKSTILKEMSSFHYYVAELQYNKAFTKCRVKDYFYYQKFMNTKTNAYVDNIRKSESNANFEETVLYYIVYNVFQNFRQNFEKITTLINKKLNDYLNSSEYILLSFNLITLMFGLLLIFIVTYSIKNYRQKILKLIFDIFIKDKTDPIFLDKLKNFMTIAKNFDKKICLDFEFENKRIFLEELIKLHNDPNLFLNEEGMNIFNNNNKANNNDSINNSTMQLMNKPSNNTNSSSVPPLANSTGRIRMRGKNKKENINNKINTESHSNINNNNSNTISNNTGKSRSLSDEPAQNQNEKKFTNDFSNINIMIIKISYLFLIIAFFCYLSLSLSNILLNKSQYKSLVVANQISLNFLDRIPKFAELILYYRISIIFNNVNFIITPQSNYKSLLYSDFFNLQFTPNTETLFNTLKDSEFSHIYYNLLIIRENIDMFMRSDEAIYKSFLPNIRNFEKQMNSPEFCSIYRINNQILQYDDDVAKSLNTIYNSFEFLNSEAKECLQIGNGINKYGMNIALNSLVASTKDLYLDFYRAGDRADITQFLTKKNFLRAVLNTEYTFNKANSNYLNMIWIDMASLYNNIKFGEFIYSCVGLTFNCVFIFFIILGVIKKLQKYYISLNSAVDKFKVALVLNHHI